MRQIAYIIFLGFIIAFAACDKTEPYPEPPPTKNYQPVTKGSSWTYSGLNGGANYNIEITGSDTMLGREYATFIHSIYGSGGYRQDDGSYYVLYMINGNPVEFLYLKDNEDVGASWNVEHSLGGTPTRITSTIEALAETKIVNGLIYKDVITLHVDTYYDMGAGYVLAASGIQYYANNVGFTFSDIDTEGMTYLEFYTIK